MLLPGLHTMHSCTVKLVQRDNSHKHSSSNHSSSSHSSQLLVLMERQQVLLLQHSRSLVSTYSLLSEKLILKHALDKLHITYQTVSSAVGPVNTVELAEQVQFRCSYFCFYV